MCVHLFVRMCNACAGKKTGEKMCILVDDRMLQFMSSFSTENIGMLAQHQQQQQKHLFGNNSQQQHSYNSHSHNKQRNKQTIYLSISLILLFVSVFAHIHFHSYSFALVLAPSRDRPFYPVAKFMLVSVCMGIRLCLVHIQFFSLPCFAYRGEREPLLTISFGFFAVI